MGVVGIEGVVEGRGRGVVGGRVVGGRLVGIVAVSVVGIGVKEVVFCFLLGWFSSISILSTCIVVISSLWSTFTKYVHQ
jgi:hypothetical protein